MRKSWKVVSILVAAFIATGLLLVACESNNATTAASCAFVVGDGQSGHDAKLHRVLYPGQQTNVGGDELISFVPCNSRNFIINDGTVKDANQNVVGDRQQPIQATTNTGVPINISVSAYWTLNESNQAMKDFYAVCFKYQCASDKDIGGNANYSTKGWNGMLAENFGPALDRVARQAAIKVDDSIWQTHNPDQYKSLSDSMSANFADVVRATLGYQDDLFCGSGNSSWSNPNDPGNGSFNCSPVRIVVDNVQRGQVQAEDSTQGVATINAQRLKNAQALYGADAGSWLALQDAIDKCKGASATCMFNIGVGTNTSTLQLPPATATPKQ